MLSVKMLTSGRERHDVHDHQWRRRSWSKLIAKTVVQDSHQAPVVARGVTGVQPITNAVEEVEQQDAKDIIWSITQPLASRPRAGRRSSPPFKPQGARA